MNRHRHYRRCDRHINFFSHETTNMDLKKKKPVYQTLAKSYEQYAPPVTLPYPDWVNYVSSGDNTLYGDAIVPGGTTDDGAVYTGHVRQNPWTAGYPMYD